MNINPYLGFDGNCEEAINFYHKVLGGQIEAMMSHAGTPMESQVPPEWVSRIMHARLRIGDAVIMASDAPPGRYSKPQGITVSLNIESPEEAERIFHALADNGQVQMPIQQTFWATRFGMLVDRFDIPWMINCEPPRA